MLKKLYKFNPGDTYEIGGNFRKVHSTDSLGYTFLDTNTNGYTAERKNTYGNLNANIEMYKDVSTRAWAVEVTADTPRQLVEDIVRWRFGQGTRAFDSVMDTIVGVMTNGGKFHNRITSSNNDSIVNAVFTADEFYRLSGVTPPREVPVIPVAPPQPSFYINGRIDPFEARIGDYFYNIKDKTASKITDVNTVRLEHYCGRHWTFHHLLKHKHEYAIYRIKDQMTYVNSVGKRLVINSIDEKYVFAGYTNQYSNTRPREIDDFIGKLHSKFYTLIINNSIKPSKDGKVNRAVENTERGSSKGQAVRIQSKTYLISSKSRLVGDPIYNSREATVARGEAISGRFTSFRFSRNRCGN